MHLILKSQLNSITNLCRQRDNRQQKGKNCRAVPGDLHKIDKQCQSDNDVALFGIPTGFRLSPPPGHTSLSRLAQAVSVSWRRHTAPLSGQTDNASAICKGLRIQRPSAGVRPRLTDALSASHSVYPFAGLPASLPGCLPVWSTLLIWICSSGAEERTYNFNCQHW